MGGLQCVAALIAFTLFVVKAGADEGSGIKPVRPQVPGLKDTDLPLPYVGDTITAAKVNIDPSTIATPGQGFDKDNIVVDIEGSGPTAWSVSRWNDGDFAMRIAPRHGFAQNNLGVPPGSAGFTTSDPKDFSAQAWRPHPERGVTLASIATNGVKGQTESDTIYGVIAASTDSSGYGYSMIDGTFGHADPSLDINIGALGPVGESSMDFSVAWFPYAQGWIGGFLDSPSSQISPAAWLTPRSKSASLPANAAEVVTWWERGAYVSLPGVEPQKDGMLFTIATDPGEYNSATNVVSVYPDKNRWIVTIREDAAVDPAATAALAEWRFSFLYVPYSADGLSGGWIGGSDGKAKKSAGMPMVKRLGQGTYQIGPCMRKVSGRDGVLLLQAADKEPNVKDAVMAKQAFLSYNYTADGKMIVEARSVISGGLNAQTGMRHSGAVGIQYPLMDTDFYFMWVDFRNPVTPNAASTMSSSSGSSGGAGFGLGFMFGLVGTLLMGSVTWIVLKYVYNRPRGGQSLVALSDFGQGELDADLLEPCEEYGLEDR